MLQCIRASIVLNVTKYSVLFILPSCAIGNVILPIYETVITSLSCSSSLLLERI